MVPTVDLEAADAQEALARAFSELGFAQLTGHGLGRPVVDDLRSVCRRFFDLPGDVKAGYVDRDPLANRGHRARGSEALRYSLGDESPPDLFESFNCGRDPGGFDSPLRRATPWPDDEVDGFSAAALAYVDEMERLSARLDRMIAEHIGWPELADRSGSGPDTLACIDYRPDPDGREPTVVGQQRMGAHSDYTTFTLLCADPVPGLQIVGPDGWLDVVPDPEALLVNVGDVLAMLTNDRWPSTLHRVVPMTAGSAPTRRSFAYFHYPDLDVQVSPLAHWVGADEDPHYPPVTVAEHVSGKLAAPKLHTDPTGASTVAGRDV